MHWLTGEEERRHIARELREWYPGATYHIKLMECIAENGKMKITALSFFMDC